MKTPILIHVQLVSETEFQFASYYASNMVLQRAPSAAVVWGYAANVGDAVSLTISGEEYTTTADSGKAGSNKTEIFSCVIYC